MWIEILRQSKRGLRNWEAAFLALPFVPLGMHAAQIERELGGWVRHSLSSPLLSLSLLGGRALEAAEAATRIRPLLAAAVRPPGI